MARPSQQSCGLCALQKPDPVALPPSPHWIYSVNAKGHPTISEGSCVHCRYVVYKQLKSTFSELKKKGNERKLEQAVRDSKKRRFVMAGKTFSKQPAEGFSFVHRSESKVKTLKKSATV